MYLGMDGSMDSTDLRMDGSMDGWIYETKTKKTKKIKTKIKTKL
jgi:hypothetical protein